MTPRGAREGGARAARGQSPDGRSASVYLSPWRVDFTVRPGVPRIYSRIVLARGVRAALEASGAPSPASVGLILSHDAELAELNAQAMGRREPTDVLSFPLLPRSAFPAYPGRDRGVAELAGATAESSITPGDPVPAFPRPPAFVLPPGQRLHLGDIVVSVERAVIQASEGRGGQTGDVRWSPAEELRLLVTHGALHLCGWDHERQDEEATMRELERKLLRER